MKTFKAEINKIILGLASVGLLILLMLPASLSANHFRYGTMSWEPISDNGTHVTIRLKMVNGWRTAYNNFLKTVGSRNSTWVDIIWGDGSAAESVDLRTISIDSTTGSSLTEMGVWSSSVWTTGVTHSYPDNGTTEYVAYWTGGDRISGIKNGLSNKSWRGETKVNIGGTYDGNVSPVSAVPPIVKVQDNTTDNFMYQVVATDAIGDNLSYRWGT